MQMIKQLLFLFGVDGFLVLGLRTVQIYTCKDTQDTLLIPRQCGTSTVCHSNDIL